MHRREFAALSRAMLVPIRCFTCNGLVRFREYEAHIDDGKTPLEAFTALEVTRYCCRRMLLCNPTELTDLVSTHTMDDLVVDSSESTLKMRMRNVRCVSCE